MTRTTAFRERPLRALRKARETYRKIAELLLDRIHAAVTGAGEVDLKQLMTMIVAHQNALKTVQDLESGVERKISERLGAAAGLDLAAARREILGKLAGLASRERRGGAA